MTANYSLVRLTYNCEPDTLSDITPTEFTDAMEMRFNAAYPEADLTVTFQTAKSGITSLAVIDDASDDPRDYEADVKEIARQAFNDCCENG